MPPGCETDRPDRAPIRRWTKLRLWTGYLYIAAALVFAKPVLFLVPAGLFLILIGISVRLVASATLVKDSELCVRGIFSATRNPLYLGSALIGLGFAFLASRWQFFAAFLFLLVPVYAKAILLEESFLTAIYKEQYTSYCREVPRFFPKLSALPKFLAFANAKLLWRSREITSAAFLLAAAALILILHTTWLPA